jgi:hypothetical protein
MDRISDLKGLGLKARHMVTSFLAEQVAPLQMHSHPMLEYKAPRDSTRRRKGRPCKAELDRQVNQLLASSLGSLDLLEGIATLFDMEAGERERILGAMPCYDACGLVDPPVVDWSNRF